MNYGLVLLSFFVCYTGITIIGVFHTFYHYSILKIGQLETNDNHHNPAYLKTLPYQMIYHLLFWPGIAYWVLMQTSSPFFWLQVFSLSLSWILLTLVFDYIKHHYYKHPMVKRWNLFNYIIVLVSPFIGGLVNVLVI